MKAGAEDIAQGQVLKLHNQPALWDPSQSPCWRLEEEALVVGEHPVCLEGQDFPG